MLQGGEYSQFSIGAFGRLKEISDARRHRSISVVVDPLEQLLAIKFRKGRHTSKQLCHSPAVRRNARTLNKGPLKGSCPNKLFTNRNSNPSVFEPWVGMPVPDALILERVKPVRARYENLGAFRSRRAVKAESGSVREDIRGGHPGPKPVPIGWLPGTNPKTLTNLHENSLFGQTRERSRRFRGALSRQVRCLI